MKKLLMIIATLSFIAITGAVSAQAQVTTAVVADIPFDFSVGKTTLAAGKYTVKPLGSMIGDGVMEIVSGDGTSTRLFLTGSVQANEPPRDGELIFHHIGERYFLYEIFDLGDSLGAMIPKSRVERRLEEEANLTESPVVTVHALSRIEARN